MPNLPKRIITALAAIALLQSSCLVPASEQPVETGQPSDGFETGGIQAGCVPGFPDAKGWLGGDAAYSIPMLDPASSLWLFGDSFVGLDPDANTRTFPFIHNSIGLSRCAEGGHWSLDTFWDRSDPETPAAFFKPDADSPWARDAVVESGRLPYYWPFDGFIVDEVLFIGLLRIVDAEPRGPFRLPFRVAGMDLARIENPRDPPERWQIRISTLSESPLAYPGAAFVKEAGYIYAFTALTAFDGEGSEGGEEGEEGESPRALSRLPIRALDRFRPDLSSELETYDRSGRWRNGFAPEEARILMSDSASEMSVHFDPEIEQWVAVYVVPTPPSHAGTPRSTKVRIRVADRLEGPWSPPGSLFAIPETVSSPTHPVDGNLFCYAAKAHPQFAEAGRLLVTYVCNLFARSEAEAPAVLERLLQSPHLYRPRAISIPIPSSFSTRPSVD